MYVLWIYYIYNGICARIKEPQLLFYGRRALLNRFTQNTDKIQKQKKRNIQFNAEGSLWANYLMRPLQTNGNVMIDKL